MRMFKSSYVAVAVLCTAVLAKADKPMYKAVGGEAVLTPGIAVPDDVTIVTWKHGRDLAIQWDGKELYAYRQFEDRGALNTSTAALTITGLTRNDSGLYTLDINDKVHMEIELLVISPVSKPHISTWCHPAKTYCVFTCEGNTTDAEPITYEWRADDMVLSSTNVHNISKDETKPEFSCILKNEVSFMSSDAVHNPFALTRIRLWVLLPFGVGLLVVVLVFIFRFCRKGKGDRRRSGGKVEEGTPEEHLEMSPNGQNERRQDNDHSESVSLEDQETQHQNSTSPVAMSTCNGTVKPSGEGPASEEPPVDEQAADEDEDKV